MMRGGEVFIFDPPLLEGVRREIEILKKKHLQLEFLAPRSSLSFEFEVFHHQRITTPLERDAIIKALSPTIFDSSFQNEAGLKIFNFISNWEVEEKEMGELLISLVNRRCCLCRIRVHIWIEIDPELLD